MKRKWTCILLVLGLLLALTGGAALAEGELAPVFRFDNPNTNIAIVPEEARGVITPDGWINGMTVENLDDLISAYGETIPVWSFELLDGEDVEAYDGEQEMDHAVFHFGRQPENDGDITYRVSCDWNGHVGTNEITFTAATLPQDNLPTGNTLQPMYVIGAGETLTVTGDLIPSGWRVPGREDECYFGLWEYDFTHQNPEDYTITEIDEITVTFTSDKPGVYVFNGFLSRGGVIGGQEVCIVVTDSGDDSPVHISAQPGTNPLASQWYSINAAAPGAAGMRLYMWMQDYFENGQIDIDHFWRTSDSETIYSEDWITDTSTWVYGASAYINGQWTDPRNCTVYLTATAPNGELEGELLTLSALEIQPDGEITITFNAIHDDAWVADAWLWGNDNTANPEIPREFGTFTVSGQDLTPGAIYTVVVNAVGVGYENCSQTARFMVDYVDYANDLGADDPNSSLTIRTPGKEYDTFTDHPFTLFAPGANTIEWKVFRVNENGDLEEEDSDREYGEGVYEPYRLKRSYPGDYVLKARACFGLWENEEDWSSFDDCQVTFTVNSPNGRLDEPDAWTYMSAPQGSDILVYFNGNENAESYGYWYRLEDGGESLGGDGITVDENTEYPIVMHLATDDLEPGSLYRIMLDVDAPGYQEGHKETLFIVEGAPDESITFTTPDSLNFGQDFEVHVDAPGADEVIIFTSLDGERRCGEYHEEEGYSEWYYSGDVGAEGGTIWIWAAAHIDGSWNHVTECRAIPVAPAQGQADSPDLSMSSTSVRRGNFKKAVLGAVSQDAIDYRVVITNSNGDWCGDYGRSGPGAIYIPTYNLPVGTYKVHGYVRAEGYLNGESATDLTFKVTSPSTYQGGLYVANPNLQTGEKLIWSMYAKGADHVALCVTDDPDRMDPEENWWYDQDGDGAFEHDWLYTCFNHPGTYYAYIGAHFHNDGTGDDWWECVGSPVELHVTAPNGFAPAPEVEYAPLAAVGEDYVFTVRPAENTVFEVIVQWDPDWSVILLGERDCRGETTFTVDRQFFENPDSYVIQIWTRYENGIYGYEEDRQEFRFRTEYNPGSDRVTVAAETYEKLIHSGDVQITVSAPGAERLALCNQWGEFDSIDGDYWERGVGDDMVYAKALIDGEWYTSEAVCIHWISYGESETVYPVLEETSPERGELLIVDIPEAEHTDWYHVSIKDEDGNEYWWRDYFAPGTYGLPTANLESDRDYYVFVRTFGVGYESRENDRDESVRFTVTEPDGAVLAIEKNDVLTYERVVVSVYAPGAECVRFSNGYRGEDDPGWWEEYGWEGDSWQDSISWGLQENNITLRAEGLYDGEWRLIGEETVNVSAPNGRVPAPEIECERLTAVDEDYVFTVRPAENVVYNVSVVWNGDHSFDLMRENDCRGERTFTVDKQYIDNPDDFLLRVWTRPEDGVYGYEEDCQEIRFRAEYNPGSELVTVTAEKYEALVNEDVQITVSAPGATELKLCNEWGEFDSRDGDFWQRGVGEEVVYAQALIDDEWYTSEAIVIHRTSRGQCGVSDPILAKTNLAPGELLSITIPESEHAEWYHTRIRDNDWNEYCFYNFSAPGTYMLPTANLESDREYFVIVSTGAVGYDWNDNDRDTATRFTVTEPEGSIFEVEKTDVLTYERVVVSVYAPGAECVRFSNGYRGEDDPGWWEEYGWEGDSWQDSIIWCLQENNITLRAEGLYEGEWRLIGEETVQVSAPYGVVPVPELAYAGLTAVGEDYAFTVSPAEGVVYNVSVSYDWNWGWELLRENDCRGERTFTFDKQFIDHPDTYAIRVWTRYEDGIYGYDEGCIIVCFRSENNPGSGRVTITAEKYDALVNEDVQITVSAPGATELKLFNERGEFDSRDGDFWQIGVGEEMVYAQALIEGEWYTSEAIVIHRTHYGQCTPADPVLAKTSLTRGELLTITIPESEHATWYDTRIRDNDWNEYCYRRYTAAGTYTLPTANLEPDREYFVHVGTGAVGYDWNDNDRNTATRFTVTEPEDGVLTVEKTDVLTNEGIVVSVYAPGAERIRFADNYQGANEPNWWDGENGWEGSSWQENNFTWPMAADAMHLRAEGLYDGEWRLIGEETVHVSAPYGGLDAPSASMPDKAYIGETITLHFDETPNATSYSSWVHEDDSGNWITGEGRDSAGDFVINTNDLRGSGVYWVELNVGAPGYEQSHGVLHLALLDPDDQDLSQEGFYFTAGATEIATSEGVHLIYYVPGAEAVRIIERDETEWGDYRDGPGMDRWESWGWPEEVPVYVTARFNGEWTEPVYVCTINVTSSNGSLGDLHGGAFMSAAQGNDIEVHFDGNENGKDYGYWFRLEDGGDGLGGDGITVDENTEYPIVLHLPTDDLEPGSLYRLIMDVSATGYVQAHKETLFIVEGNPDENVTLSAPDSLAAGQPFEVHVEAPGADEVIIYTSLDGERRNEYNNQEGNTEGYTADGFNMEGGTVWVWAAAHIDGSWNHVTECKAIPISAPEGQADAPAFSLENTNVLRGDFVKATLGAVSQDAFNYRVYFWNENGEWYGDFGRGDAGDIYIPTANLPAGTYTVHGYVRAEGYMNGESEEDLTFTVNDPDDYPGGLYVLNPNLATGDKLVWSLYAKYADHVALCVTDDPDRVNQPEENWWADGDGDWMYAEDGRYDHFNNPGDYYAYIGAHFYNGEAGSEWWDYVGAPVEIHVSSPNGELSSPSASMPDKAYLGDTINLHFDETPNAVTYSYWVHPDDSNDWITGGQREGAGDLVIDTNDLRGSGVYWVELDVNAPGYTEGHGTLHVAVLDHDDQELSQEAFYFTVGSTDIHTREDVHFIYYVPGAEAVRIAFYDEWGEERNGPGMDIWWSWGNAQQVPVSVAFYCDGEWSDPLYMCTINVDAPNGRLDEPNFSMPTAVNPGEDVVITFYGNENAVSYSYWYERVDDGCWMGNDGRSLDDGPITFPLELRIPAEQLEPGRTYRVYLDVNNPGWAEGHTDRLLTVSDPDNQHVTLKVNKSTSAPVTMAINKEYPVKVTASGAAEVGFFDGWNWYWESGSSYTWTWSDMTPGTRQMIAQARYDDGSVAYSRIIEITYTQEGDCGKSHTTAAGAVYGGDITVEIGTANGAAWYDLHIVRAEDTDDHVYYCRYTAPGTVSISTVEAQLLPGDYYAYVTTAGPGYGWSSEWYDDGPQEKDLFTVTEGQKYFQADKTEVEVMEKLYVQVYDPEATRIRFDSGYGWWGEYEGDDTGWEVENGYWENEFSWDCGPDNVTIKADGLHGEEWVEIGSADITITAPNGQIGEPTVIVSRYQNITEGLWFGVEMPENGAEYDIEVWEYPNNDHDDENREWVVGCQRHQGNDWFHVEPELLELGRTYYVFVRAMGYGYVCNEACYEVTMVEPQPAPEFTVASDTVRQGEFFHVTITNYDPDTNYHAYFRGGNIEDLQDVSVLYDGEHITLATDSLEPNDYRLCVDVYDKPGAADNGAECNVTVTANGEEAIFILATDSTDVGIPVLAFAHAEGAERIRILLTQDGRVDGQWYQDGDTYDKNEVGSWGVGEYVATAEAYMNGEWTQIGETIALSVGSQGNVRNLC